MSSMNARVVFVDMKRGAADYRSVKIGLEQGWVVLEDQHGEKIIYPSHAVSRIEAKPTSYDRGSW